MHLSSIWIIGAVIAAVALYLTTFRKSKKYNYPPSPPGYNFFKGGHAYLLPPGLDVLAISLHADISRQVPSVQNGQTN
jgi:hypothetical protein